MTEKEAFEYLKQSAKELGLSEDESTLQASIWLNDAYYRAGEGTFNLIILGVCIGVLFICMFNLL